MNIKQKLASFGLSFAVVLSGVYLVAPFEGKENNAYLDPADILTICYGETRNVSRGEYRTDAECLEMLGDSLSRHDDQMLRYIKVPMTDYQHAAFLSFTYNVGVNAFKNSTLLKKLNNYDYEGACNQLLRWNKAKGVVLKGLTRRREAEHRMCMGIVSQEVEDEYEKSDKAIP